MVNMVNVSSFLGFFGKSVTCLKTGSELAFIGSCNKYLNYMSGGTETLVLDVDIDRKLLRCNMLQYMLAMGVVAPQLAEQRRSLPDGFFTGSVIGGSSAGATYVNSVVFADSQTSNELVFDFDADAGRNNFMVNDMGGHPMYKFLDLFAYAMVYSFVNSVILRLRITYKPSDKGRCYSQLWVLLFYGNKLADGLLSIEDSDLANADWVAYVTMQRQYGYYGKIIDGKLCGYDADDKLNLAKKTFQVGDLAFLYTRTKASESDNKIRSLTSCSVIQIIGMDARGVEYLKFPDFSTVLTRGAEGFPQIKERQSWISVGVDPFVFDEDIFISELKDGDTGVQKFMTTTGIEECTLGVYDDIYAVAENRGINYNRERFLQKYFPNYPNQVPFYDRVVDGRRIRDMQPTKYERLSEEALYDKYVRGFSELQTWGKHKLGLSDEQLSHYSEDMLYQLRDAWRTNKATLSKLWAKYAYGLSDEQLQMCSAEDIEKMYDQCVRRFTEEQMHDKYVKRLNSDQWYAKYGFSRSL